MLLVVTPILHLPELLLISGSKGNGMIIQSISVASYASYFRKYLCNCFSLAWINSRCPPKPLYHSTSSAGQERGNMMKGSRVKIKTGRDHSPITVTDKTD